MISYNFHVAIQVAVEHAIGELMFNINLLSFSVTDEEVERAKRELKATLVNGGMPGIWWEKPFAVIKHIMAYSYPFISSHHCEVWFWRVGVSCLSSVQSVAGLTAWQNTGNCQHSELLRFRKHSGELQPGTGKNEQSTSLSCSFCRVGFLLMLSISAAHHCHAVSVAWVFFWCFRSAQHILSKGRKGSLDLRPRCAPSRDDASNWGRGCWRGEV